MTANDLKPFCGNAGAWNGKPFTVQVHDDWWTVASDGRHALCVREDVGDFADLQTDIRHAETARYIAGQIAGGNCKVMVKVVLLSELRAFCGPYDPGDPGTECEACDGRGEQECLTCWHADECDRCHGRGVIGEHIPKDRHGLLLGLCVDLNRLARLLAVMPGDAVEVTVGTENDPVVFRAMNMVVVLMPLTVGFTAERLLSFS